KTRELAQRLAVEVLELVQHHDVPLFGEFADQLGELEQATGLLAIQPEGVHESMYRYQHTGRFGVGYLHIERLALRVAAQGLTDQGRLSDPAPARDPHEGPPAPVQHLVQALQFLVASVELPSHAINLV